MSLTWLSGCTETCAAASTQAQNHLVDLAKYYLHDPNRNFWTANITKKHTAQLAKGSATH